MFGHMPFIKWKQQENNIKYIMSYLSGISVHCKIASSNSITSYLTMNNKGIEETCLCDVYEKNEEKKKEIWPSHMTKTPIPTENSKTKGQHTQRPPKTSITQQLRTDLGRSVGVTSNPTGVVKPVYGIPTKDTISKPACVTYMNKKSRTQYRIQD